MQFDYEGRHKLRQEHSMARIEDDEEEGGKAEPKEQKIGKQHNPAQVAIDRKWYADSYSS